MTNFQFLKSIDSSLYEIAYEAEKLYRDEYFQQCMGQTRRLGENVCRQVLGEKAKKEDSFDEMINTLKDSSRGNSREKEFIEDLYFLKKAGNESVHSAKVKKDGITALECLQRAFEASINFAVYKKGPDSKILKLQYDEEMLVLGKSSKKSLQEKYIEKKKETPKAANKAKMPKKTISRQKSESPKRKKSPSKSRSSSMSFMGRIKSIVEIIVMIAVVTVVTGLIL